jgi:Domain of unknown function (DUF4397)
MFKKGSVVALLVLSLVFAGFGPALAAKNSNSTMANVYVIHGINGIDLGADKDLPVDIFVGGVGCALTSFPFMQVAGPVALPGGTYNIQISLANPSNPCSNAPVITGDFTFEAGMTYSVIAYLTAAGAPTAAQFTNDVSNTGRGKTRISLAHTAYAPEVDIYLSGKKAPMVLEDVSNGAFAPLSLRAGRYSVELKLANTDTSVLGPASFVFKPNISYFNFVVGSATNGLYVVSYEVKTFPTKDASKHEKLPKFLR